MTREVGTGATRPQAKECCGLQQQSPSHFWGAGPRPLPDFSPGKLTSNSWPPDRDRIYSGCSVVICYSSLGKPMQLPNVSINLLERSTGYLLGWHGSPKGK